MRLRKGNVILVWTELGRAQLPMPLEDVLGDAPPLRGNPSSPSGEKPSLFALQDDEILHAVAVAMATRVASEKVLASPNDLCAFDESALGLDGPPFDGSSEAIQDLLLKIVHAGLDVQVR